MGHDSAKLGQDGAKMVSLRLTWEVFEAFWEDLGTWGWITENLQKPLVFFVFSYFRVVLAAIFADLGAMLSHLGATWRHYGTGERQDKPR